MTAPDLDAIRARVEAARDLLPPESIEYDETQDFLAHLANDIDHLLSEDAVRIKAEMLDWLEGRRSWANLGPHEPYTPDVIAAMDATEVIKRATVIQAMGEVSALAAEVSDAEVEAGARGLFLCEYPDSKAWDNFPDHPARKEWRRRAHAVLTAAREARP